MDHRVFNRLFLNRLFAVRVNNTITNKLIISAGVPQGAVLSPTLFSIFINDISINYLINKCYSLLFADDLCAYYIFKQKRTVVKKIQMYLDRIEKWLKAWRLTMTTNKCSYIVFSSDKSHVDENELEITFVNMKTRAQGSSD